MDFIEALPKSEGKEVILVIVVDCLSKYAHFVALAHPYAVPSVAKAFMEHIYKLHGMPTDIVSDRGSVFISAFWQEFMKHLKVQLKLSTSYHPQIDGQTEVMNRSVETYLRCMTDDFLPGGCNGSLLLSGGITLLTTRLLEFLLMKLSMENHHPPTFLT